MAATNIKVSVIAPRSCSEAHYRCLLPARATFEALTELVRQVVPTELNFGSLVYVDDDGDAVQLRSDADLHAALAALRAGKPSKPAEGSEGGKPEDEAGVLRLQVAQRTPPPGRRPCCVVGGCGAAFGAFALAFFAAKGCCPCVFFIIMLMLGRFACKIGSCCARPPSAPTRAWACWAAPTVPATAAAAAACVPVPRAAQRLAVAWDVDEPEAVGALLRAQFDPNIAALINQTLRHDDQDAAAAAAAAMMPAAEAKSGPPSYEGAAEAAALEAAAQEAEEKAAELRRKAAQAQANAAAQAQAAAQDVQAAAKMEADFVSVSAPPNSPSSPSSPISPISPTLPPPPPLEFAEQLAVLTTVMGFEEDAALAALETSGGDVKRAVQALLRAP